MKIYSNKVGFIIGFSIPLIYIIFGNHLINLKDFLIIYTGPIIITILLSFLINFFYEQKNLGKIFGITSLLYLIVEILYFN